MRFVIRDPKKGRGGSGRFSAQICEMKTKNML